MHPTFLLIPALVLSLAAPALAAPASRLQAVEAAYDQQALALGLTGTPRYAVERVSPTHFVVWLENVQLSSPARAGTLGAHAWAIAEQAGAVRLEVAMASPGSPVVALEEGRHRLLVMPQPDPAGVVPEDGITTILGRASFDLAADALVVPYYGRSPRVSVSAAGATAVQVDLANAAITPSGLQLQRLEEHPLVTTWSLARVPHHAASRLVLSYRYPGGAEVQVDQARQRLLIRPVLGPAAAPRFTAKRVGSVVVGDRRPPTQWLTAAPTVKPAPAKTPPSVPPGQPVRVVIEMAPGQGAPQVITVPTGPQPPVATPAPPIPEPTPAAPPAPAPEPTPSAAPVFTPGELVRRAGLQLRPEFTGEALVGGAVDFGPALVPAAALNLRYDLDAAWTLGGAFSYRDYTLTDAAAPASRHHRDDFILEAHAAYRLPVGTWQPIIGLGYYGRRVSVANSAPPPLTRPFVFAPTQTFHGPVLLGALEGALGGGWRAEAQVSARPYLFTGGHETVSALGGLFGYVARPAVSFSWNGLEARAGYDFDYTTAYTNDFTHIKHGPFVDAAWRF